MSEPVKGLTARAEKVLTEMVTRHRQRLPDVGRRTRRAWPQKLGTSPIPGGDCDCCPGCVCYPSDPDDVTDACGAIGCLLKLYQIVSQALPFSSSPQLAHVSGCIFESDSFNVTLCDDQDYGDHFWRLTVASGCCATTLELINDGGTDIPLKYVNVRPFRAFCATEFAFEENCDLYADDYLKSIAASWPTKLCVNPVGDGSCVPCELPPISTLCCPDDPIPATIYDTITGDVSTVVTMTWVDADVWYHGTFVAGGCTMDVYLKCVGSSWQIVTRVNTGGAGCIPCEGNNFAPIVSCNPFLVTGSTSLGPTCPYYSSGTINHSFAA